MSQNRPKSALISATWVLDMAVPTIQYNSSIGEFTWKYLSLYDKNPSYCLPKTNSTFKKSLIHLILSSRTCVLPYSPCPQFASGSYCSPDSFEQWNQETSSLALLSSHGLCSVSLFMFSSSYGLFSSAHTTSENLVLLSCSCWSSNMVSIGWWPPSMSPIFERPQNQGRNEWTQTSNT